MVKAVHRAHPLRPCLPTLCCIVRQVTISELQLVHFERAVTTLNRAAPSEQISKEVVAEIRRYCEFPACSAPPLQQLHRIVQSFCLGALTPLAKPLPYDAELLAAAAQHDELLLLLMPAAVDAEAVEAARQQGALDLAASSHHPPRAEAGRAHRGEAGTLDTVVGLLPAERELLESQLAEEDSARLAASFRASDGVGRHAVSPTKAAAEPAPQALEHEVEHAEEWQRTEEQDEEEAAEAAELEEAEAGSARLLWDAPPGTAEEVHRDPSRC